MIETVESPEIDPKDGKRSGMESGGGDNKNTNVNVAHDTRRKEEMNKEDYEADKLLKGIKGKSSWMKKLGKR